MMKSVTTALGSSKINPLRSKHIFVKSSPINIAGKCNSLKMKGQRMESFLVDISRPPFHYIYSFNTTGYSSYLLSIEVYIRTTL